MAHKKLGQLLIAQGVLSEVQLSEALKLQKEERPRSKLGDLLIAKGMVEERQMYWALAQQLGFEFMELENNTALGSAIEEIPGEMARTLGVFPTIATPNGSVFVATCDPKNADMLNQLLHHTGKKIQLFIATPSEIENAITKYYGTPETDAQAQAQPPALPPPMAGDDAAPPPIPMEELSVIDDDDFMISLGEDTPPPHTDLGDMEQELSDLLQSVDDEPDSEDGFDFEVDMQQELKHDFELEKEATPPLGYSIPDAADEKEATEGRLEDHSFKGFEPDFSSTTDAEIENIERELSDLLVDDGLSQDLGFEDSATPPAGTDVGDMDAALSDLLSDDEDDLGFLDFEEGATPPAGTDVGDMDAELSDLLSDDDDELSLDFEEGATPPAGTDVGDMDAELSDLLSDDDDDLSLDFEEGATPPAGTDVGNMDAELSELLSGEEDDLSLDFEDIATPPAGTDVGNMDAELSDLFADDEDELVLDFEDSATPPVGTDLGKMDAELSDLLSDDDEEDPSKLEFEFEDSSTPPAGTDVGDMDAELSDLLSEEGSQKDVVDSSDAKSTNEVDETSDDDLLGLFEDDENLERDTVVDFELGFNPQETPPAGISVKNMDAELAALFSDEGDAYEPELEVAPLPKSEDTQPIVEEDIIIEPLPKLDPDLPFHLAPWGLLVARKHGMDTASILERLQSKSK